MTGNNSGGAPVWNSDKHGTACAGIIAAIGDNSQGISGVAPNTKLISIHASNMSGGISVSNVSNAIRITYLVGADIINCSFGGGSPSDQITNAVNDAITKGRNGKGCIMVFSSGNSNHSTVEYPSILNGVISVGAIDRCGIRAGRQDIIPNSCDPWGIGSEPGSSYGSGLSVVAPGTNIYTTDRQGNLGYNTSYGTSGDYCYDFGGTSASAPFVSGVAALILSVNPNLTAQQVRRIIESTAQKIRTDLYFYNNDGCHPNGTWNDTVGYGLVDAYAAVCEAKKSDLYVRDTVTDDGSMPSTCYSTWDSPDIWIADTNMQWVSHPCGNTKYAVCVKIHNRRDMASSGTERLFLNWAKAGFNDSWDEYWTGNNPLPCGAPKGGVIGSKVTGKAFVNTSSLAAGSYTVKLISSGGNIYDNKTLVIR